MDRQGPCLQGDWHSEAGLLVHGPNNRTRQKALRAFGDAQKLL